MVTNEGSMKYAPTERTRRLGARGESGAGEAIKENMREIIADKWDKLSRFAEGLGKLGSEERSTQLPHTYDIVYKDSEIKAKKWIFEPVRIPLRGGGELRVGHVEREGVTNSATGKHEPICALVIGVKTIIPEEIDVSTIPDTLKTADRNNLRDAARKEMKMTDLGDYQVHARVLTEEEKKSMKGSTSILVGSLRDGEQFSTHDSGVNPEYEPNLDVKEPIHQFLAQFDATKDIDVDALTAVTQPQFKVLELLGFDFEKARAFSKTMEKPFTKPGAVERVRKLVGI